MTILQKPAQEIEGSTSIAASGPGGELRWRDFSLEALDSAPLKCKRVVV